MLWTLSATVLYFCIYLSQYIFIHKICNRWRRRRPHNKVWSNIIKRPKESYASEKVRIQLKFTASCVIMWTLCFWAALRHVSAPPSTREKTRWNLEKASERLKNGLVVSFVWREVITVVCPDHLILQESTFSYGRIDQLYDGFGSTCFK